MSSSKGKTKTTSSATPEAGRVFMYARVSTAGQTTDNQVVEVRAAGFDIRPQRVVAETISGSVCAFQRPQFARLVDRLEAGDVLVVTRLDRLGRSVLDVRQTVDALAERGVRVHCLALGGADLTSAAGRMTMQILITVAEFERDLLIERTQAGLARVRSEGKKLGRRAALKPAEAARVVERLKAGEAIAALAREHGVGRATIQRIAHAQDASVL